MASCKLEIAGSDLLLATLVGICPKFKVYFIRRFPRALSTTAIPTIVLLQNEFYTANGFAKGVKTSCIGVL